MESIFHRPGGYHIRIHQSSALGDADVLSYGNWNALSQPNPSTMTVPARVLRERLEAMVSIGTIQPRSSQFSALG